MGEIGQITVIKSEVPCYSPTLINYEEFFMDNLYLSIGCNITRKLCFMDSLENDFLSGSRPEQLFVSY